MFVVHPVLSAGSAPVVCGVFKPLKSRCEKANAKRYLSGCLWSSRLSQFLTARRDRQRERCTGISNGTSKREPYKRKRCEIKPGGLERNQGVKRLKKPEDAAKRGLDSSRVSLLRTRNAKRAQTSWESPGSVALRGGAQPGSAVALSLRRGWKV